MHGELVKVGGGDWQGFFYILFNVLSSSLKDYCLRMRLVNPLSDTRESALLKILVYIRCNVGH